MPSASAAAAAVGARPVAAGPAEAPAPGAGLPSLAPAAVPAARIDAARAGASEEFPPDSSVRGKTLVLVGTKGSRPFILEEAVRVARRLGLRLILVDSEEARARSTALVPDSDFIAAPVTAKDDAGVRDAVARIASRLEAAAVDAVASFIPSNAKLTGSLVDRLGAKGIPGSAVLDADDKARTREALNKVPELAVPFRKVYGAEEASRAYSELGGGKFVMKSVRGENSQFIRLNVDSPEAAARAFAELDDGLREYAERPEARETTFNQHPGVMMERMLEKAEGTDEVSVEVVMQRGKAAFAMVSDTKFIGPHLEFAGGSLAFPSEQPRPLQAAIVAAAEKALAVIGIADGNARVDMMVTPEGPRVIEINPYMGGAGIWRPVKILTGMSLVEQGMRALFGLRVDPGAAPAQTADYRWMASPFRGRLIRVDGMEEALKSPGVRHIQMLVEPGGWVNAPVADTYEEIGEIISVGKDRAEAALNSLEALGKMTVQIQVGAKGDYLQRPAAETKDAAAQKPPSKAPALLSAIVTAFFSIFVMVQLAVETTSTVISQMTQPLQNGFMTLALLASSSYVTYSLGSLFGGRWVDTIGIDVSYRAILVIRALIWSAIAGAFLYFGGAIAAMPMALLIPLFSADYFFHSIGRLAEHKLQVGWYHGDPVSSSRFGTFRDFVEYATVIVAGAVASLVATHGFAVVLFPAPALFAVAAVISFLIKLPKFSPEKTRPIALSTGFKAIFSNPGIVKPLAGFTLINGFLYMLYYILATAFGVFVTPSPEAASAVAGSLTGFYGIGALAGTGAMTWIASRIEKAAEGLPEAERGAKRRELYVRSASRVLWATAAALLGAWLFVSQAPLGSFFWPVFAVSPALIVIGMATQMATNHLDTIIKDRIPPEHKDISGSILGALRTVTYGSLVLGFLATGALFALFGSKAFLLVGAASTAVSLFCIWLSRALQRS